MSAIDDLIAQIEDRALRERLKIETARIAKEKKFGLVFEEHLPELTPLYNAEIRIGNRVAKRGGDLSELWRVLSVSEGQAVCMNYNSGGKSEFPVDELMVVANFGEPVFPTLVPMDRIKNGPDDAPWHTLIEADNYHALQLLEYLYTGQVDCIYIDPPYNTGARDWKYNNDYVDSNDSWRHSKWLAMMNRRLKIARRLLNPKTGVLIVTIDENEHHHLRALLQEIFPEAVIQNVTIVINPKGVTQGRFSRVEEYAIYCFMPNAFVHGGDDPLLGNKPKSKKPRWKGLLRSGTNARREDSKNQFYPVLIDSANKRVVHAGETLPWGTSPPLGEKIEGYDVAWPIRTDLSEGNWGVSNTTLNNLISKGYVALGRYDEKRKTWGISYLSQKPQQQIETGELKIIGYDEQKNVVDVEYADTQERQIKTVWHRSTHDAGAYGSDLVSNILGKSRAFTFPKSVYAVRDAISAVIKNNPQALVLDFFAGSGTTLNAVNLLNTEDGGRRCCIMVTNNEVSEDEAKGLLAKGLLPGDDEWEKHGICQSITWPRSKYTILGQRDDGTEIQGEYFTGKFIEKEKPRNFYHIDFASSKVFNTAARKKRLVRIIEGIPQSLVKPDSAFILSDNEKHFASVLFDDTKVDAWLDALADHEHVTDFYIVTERPANFNSIRDQICELLGPMIVTEEEKRPIRDGFAANLEYFRLEFLEKDRVALGRQFREILPLLWLRSGAIGPRPELPDNESIPAMVVPADNPFAVLVVETYFADFLEALKTKDKITHVYLVTDSEEAFQEMASQINIPHVIQLYRDYIENFVINREGGR
ncbi:MAG: site-specific DNA-methyltransferase [Bacillota bacterium]|jgi:adenine-specific DNA-methyltransferase